MWTKAFAIMGLAAAVVVAVAGMRQTTVRRALVSEGSEVELTLERPLPNFSLDKIPLEDALARLNQAGGVGILLDRKALEAAGVDRRAPVTVPPLPKATLARLLDLTLESASTPVVRLGYTPRTDHLLVSTGDVLAKHVRIRVYDVRDMLSTQPELPVFDQPRSLDRPSRARRAGAACSERGRPRRHRGSTISCR